jgi:large subunit ribosomal protein L3
VRTKNKEKDGYEALQVGFELQKPKRINKPLLGQFTKRDLKPNRILRELRVEDSSQYTVGQELNLEGLKDVQWVDIQGTSKGKGFQGVMKRHNFNGQPGAHGDHKVHRKHGSVGQGSTPSRVFPGMRMEGRMGTDRVTAQKLRVVEVDVEKNLVLVRGSVPGGKRGVVVICESKKGKK